jgi:hypothetical protein
MEIILMILLALPLSYCIAHTHEDDTKMKIYCHEHQKEYDNQKEDCKP